MYGYRSHTQYGLLSARPFNRNTELKAQKYSRHPEIEPTAKQEKDLGGVAEELDYEMDQMSNYVAEVAQGIMMPGTKVSPPFRKFVTQVLSSTRLPGSTILLSLNYLARRMSKPDATTQYKSTGGQVWRMLIIALILGSKFLDDNTFKNRLWSEVSGIPVAELNALEMEWLLAIDFRLYVDPVTDPDLKFCSTTWNHTDTSAFYCICGTR